MIWKNNNTDWMTSCPWYKTSICKKLHGKLFEEFIRNIRTDRYNIMCSIDVHGKNNPSEHDYGINGGGYLVSLNSTTEALVSLSATIDFIGCCLKGFEQNFLEDFNMYFGNMKKKSENPS